MDFVEENNKTGGKPEDNTENIDNETINTETTDIKKCLGPEDTDDSKLLLTEDPESLVFNLTISLKTRLLALDKCQDGHQMLDILNRLGMMYMFSESKVIENYLYEIVLNSRLDNFLKLIAAKNLKEYSEKAYPCFDYLSGLEAFNIVSRLECMLILYEKEDFKARGFDHLNKFLNDQTIDCGYRYKNVIVNDSKIGEDIFKLLDGFIDKKENLGTYKNLACQYILSKNHQPLIDKAQAHLLTTLKDTSVDYNVRADACDILMQFGSDSYRSTATQLLIELSLAGQREIKTIYQNAQNVHSKSVEDSVNKILGELNSIVESKVTFELCRDEFCEFINEQKYSEEILSILNSCMLRIEVDKSIYGTVNLSLRSIFCKVWTYIKSHASRDEIRKTLVKEFLDCANGVCSSGFAFRMVNSLSGFTDFSVTISFEEQIVARLGAILNTKIMNLEDEDYKGDVLTEMSIPSEKYSERPNFLKFFRENISLIREDLYQDFKDDMSDEDFDIYIKKAIMVYQGDNF